MSLILEALRKMEQDRKSRKAAAGIRAEVLRYRATVKERQARPYLLAVAGVVLMAAGIGAGMLLRAGQDSAAKPASQRSAASEVTAPAAPAAQPAAAAAPAPAPAPVREPSAPAPVAASTAPLSAPLSKPVQPVAVQHQAEAGASKPLRKPVSATARPTPAQAAARPQAQPLPRATAQDALPVLPDITISGIAYQDERSLRRAVLNGALVGEGAEVAGARVVEIKENKVRMSRGGQLFEVVFSSGLNSR